MNSYNITNLMKILEQMAGLYQDLYQFVLTNKKQHNNLPDFKKSFNQIQHQLIQIINNVCESDSSFITQDNLKQKLANYSQSIHNLNQSLIELTSFYSKDHDIKLIHIAIAKYLKRFDRYTKNMTHSNDHLLSNNLCLEFLALVDGEPLITRKHLTLIKS